MRLIGLRHAINILNKYICKEVSINKVITPFRGYTLIRLGSWWNNVYQAKDL